MSSKVYEIEDITSFPVREAYETLKTNIKLYDFGKEIRTITVTSYRAGDGKTTTAFNLAAAIAKSGSKVLFIDADLHKPELMKNLKGTNFQGLSNLLLGHLSLQEVINKTSVEGLDFISCGVIPLNPAGLLSSSQFNDLIKHCLTLYDLIIFDTPPLGSVIDSIVVAARTDGTVFVIQPGKVSYKNIQIVMSQFKKANIQVLGVVLNKVPRLEYKGYYNQYDYYGKKKKYSRDWLRKNKNKKD